MLGSRVEGRRALVKGRRALVKGRRAQVKGRRAQSESKVVALDADSGIVCAWVKDRCAQVPTQTSGVASHKLSTAGAEWGTFELACQDAGAEE
jgi:hypothetical protein